MKEKIIELQKKVEELKNEIEKEACNEAYKEYVTHFLQNAVDNMYNVLDHLKIAQSWQDI
jgi:hypothetical protein